MQSCFRYMSSIVLNFPNDATEVEKENTVIADQTSPSLVFMEQSTPSSYGDISKHEENHPELYSHPRRRKRERHLKCSEIEDGLIRSSQRTSIRILSVTYPNGR